MVWALGLVLLLALLIPLAAVLLDVPRRRTLPDEQASLPLADDRVIALVRRLVALEDEVETIARGLEDLRDEIDVLRHLLEHPDASHRQRRPTRE